ncbi:MAG: hypothetical protein ABJB86_15505 [Bacteroidota bacterium]
MRLVPAELPVYSPQNYIRTGSGGASCNAQEAPLELPAGLLFFYKQAAPPEPNILD